MKKLLLSLSALALCLSLLGQDRPLRQVFDWEEEPTQFIIGQEVFQQWAFDGAVFGDRAPSHPHWVHRFQLDGPGELRVTVRNLSSEPLEKRPAPEDEDLGPALTFTTSVVRQPEGYFGKISCIPILRNGGTYEKVTMLDLLIEVIPRGLPRGGDPPLVSVLADGDIYKIAVSQTGIHKLTYDFLKNDLGISNLDNIDPRTIKLFGNGGGPAPESVLADYPSDPRENAITIVGESDGTFNSGDYLLFYGEGPSPMQYDAERDIYVRRTNIYDPFNYYFIKIGGGNGLRVQERGSLPNTEVTTDSYEGVFHFEEEKVNIMHELELHGSAQRWYGDFFRIARDKTYNDLFELPGLLTDEPVRVRSEMALRALVRSRFYLDVGGETLQSDDADSVPLGSGSEIYSDRAYTATLDDYVSLDDESVSFQLRYPHPGGSVQSSGWLDFIQVRARMALQFTAPQLAFRDSETLSAGSATFRLAGGSNELTVWDVSDPLLPVRQLADVTGGALSFGVAIDSTLNEFVAFQRTGNLLTAQAVGKIANQNLHGIQSADLLIVYHPDLRAGAEQLAAHRANHDGLEVVLADVNQIYNEFSGGSVDPVAIRNLAKMIFDRDPNFQYLLLFGDGSFDCREIYTELAGSNFIPVYERDDHNELYGYPADDFFGIFTDGGSLGPLAHDLSIAVGRLPVKSTAEAAAVVEKLISYDTDPETFGDWRTRMVFVGDDEDSAAHSDDADAAAQVMRSSLSYLNDTKLFLDLFPQESTPAGDFYPTVREALDQAIFKGVLAVTYLGHGGPRGWAQERILTIPMIQNWDNEKALPLFITATCTFAAYDDAAFVSTGEELILKNAGGSLTLLTTTRPVFANQNSQLTNRSLSAMLSRNADGEWPRMGDVIRTAKNEQSTPTGSGFDNVRKFTLLGDPTMRLALPRYQVATTSINGNPIGPESADTLRALDQVTITGAVTDLEGNVLTNFNGTVYPTIFDKRTNASTLQNDPGSPERTYSVQRNILFRGQATVTNGTFSFTFVMPQDINYTFGPGKISYYAADPGQEIDAGGSYEKAIIGGANEDGLNDDLPPVVEVYMNSTDFISGGRVTPNPVLVVSLSDDNGINVSGNSIGHDLEGFLNEDTQNSYLLNDFYEAATDDYTRGEVRFPLRDLPNGVHRMRVRAWDVANNMGEGFTEFVIADDAGIALQRVLNYPNPFTDQTCFQFDTDVAGSDLEVFIRIYTISGRLVKTIRTSVPAYDGALRQDDCISWDGRDDYGDLLARGVYLYQVSVRTADGLDLEGDSDFEKLVILK